MASEQSIMKTRNKSLESVALQEGKQSQSYLYNTPSKLTKLFPQT